MRRTRKRDRRLPAWMMIGLAAWAVAAAPAAAQILSARSGEVVAVRELTLKQGVDAAAFEHFVRGTFNPAWEHIIPGMKVVIMQADRGARKGGYALVFFFDSVKTRNAYFPQEGSEGTEAFEAYVKGVRDLQDELMQYVETIAAYTDYAALR